MIRTALIGVSGFANVHYDDLLREVAAGRMKALGATIVNPEQEPAKVEKLKSLGCTIFGDYMEMLAQLDGQIDLCMIPTGIHLHAPMSIHAMRAGANVFVEKPAAALFSDVLAMQAVERETGKFVAVGYQDMYGDNARKIKKAITDGRLGQLRSIKGIGMWPRDDAYYARNNWAGKLKVGADTVLDSPFNNALAHYLNLMLFFAGKGERNAATPRTVLAELFRGHDIESCDTACLRIETDENVRIDFLVTHCSEKTFGPVIRICGEKGTLEWIRGKHMRIELQDGTVEELPTEDLQAVRSKLMDLLIHRIHAPSAFICTLEMAGKQTLCANAAHKSSETRTVPARHVLRTTDKDSVKTVIIGIDDIFRKAFEQDLLLSETGAEWAAGIEAHPVDTGIFLEKQTGEQR